MADSILCPNCRAEIQVTEALSQQLRSELTQKFEADLRLREQEFSGRESDLRKREQDLAAERQSVDETVRRALAGERERLKADARREASEELAIELTDTKTALAKTQTKLTEAQNAEIEIRRKARELDDQKREFDLTLSRRLDEERARIQEAAKKEAAEERALKEAEKDKLISDLRSQIDLLKRKSEQGSEQSQGEVMELSLEALLSRAFPHDVIEAVAKGVHGGDILQTIRDSSGSSCGKILWESKHTKSWSDGWLPKLRNDQRAAKASLAVLVSTELPKDLRTFACIGGVWVTSWQCAVGIASALRSGLLEVASAKRAIEGQQGKMELLYNYLSGAEFRQRVEGIVEAFIALKQELDSEKRVTERLWAKREKQLERAVACTSGMYGDLTGIIGGALPTIASLEPGALTDGRLPTDEASGESVPALQVTTATGGAV